MNKNELLGLIDETFEHLPERISGNEVADLVADWLWPLAVSDREALIGALSHLLSFRVRPGKRGPEHAIPEERVWVALHVAEVLKVHELRKDIESLLADTRAGRTLLPVYEESIRKHLAALN